MAFADLILNTDAQFVKWSKRLCSRLSATGAWADFVDPCSGLPMVGPNTSTIFGEVDAMQTLLKYRIQDAGGCKIILHPKRGSHVYPATFFTTSSLEELKASIEQVEQEWDGVVDIQGASSSGRHAK